MTLEEMWSLWMRDSVLSSAKAWIYYADRTEFLRDKYYQKFHDNPIFVPPAEFATMEWLTFDPFRIISRARKAELFNPVPPPAP